MRTALDEAALMLASNFLSLSFLEKSPETVDFLKFVTDGLFQGACHETMGRHVKSMREQITRNIISALESVD